MGALVNLTCFILAIQTAITYLSMSAFTITAISDKANVSARSSAAVLDVYVQNLQKKAGLATKIIETFNHPDVFLAQEINLQSESEASFPASYVSRRGYGTAIYAKNGSTDLSNIRRIASPHSEHLWTIVKKTTIAAYSYPGSDVELVSFHGYNGWPRRDEVQKLVDHVESVLAVIMRDKPAIFAGDFNTWTAEHLDAVTHVMSQAGFELVYSWPYPGQKDLTLDHAFVRGMELVHCDTFQNDSDHLGALLSLEMKT